MPRLAFPLAALLLLTPLPAISAYHGDMTVVADEVWTHSGWFVLDVETTATKIGLHDGSAGLRGPSAQGFAVVYPDGAVWSLGGSTSWQSRVGVVASEPDTPAGPIHVDAAPDLPRLSSGYGTGSPLPLRDAGELRTLRIVGWSAGEITRWNFTIAMDGETTILSRTTGGGTFIGWADEFESEGAMRHAYLPTPLLLDQPHSVRSTQDASYAVDVAGSLFGRYVRLSSWSEPVEDTETWGVVKPDGSVQACDCTFRGAAAGQYVFRLDGTYAGGSDGVILAYADIPLG